MTYNRAEEGGAFVSGNENHIYIAIDLKSFYASVECRERDLDPLTTNLVVADAERTHNCDERFSLLHPYAASHCAFPPPLQYLPHFQK